ncbi:hypothetical protein JW926_09245 [Candidatus Sumerlaeota bacterium]|nr:hypothetical protein [Candidatus Sumerlaeota bacterium]
MEKNLQCLIPCLFLALLSNPVFAETVLRWKGKAYDFEGASITAGLNQSGEKAPSDLFQE